MIAPPPMLNLVDYLVRKIVGLVTNRFRLAAYKSYISSENENLTNLSQ